MRLITNILLILIYVMSLSSCGNHTNPSELSTTTHTSLEEEREVIADEARNLLYSYAAAVADRNVDKMASHYLNSPNFAYVSKDGISNRDQILEQINTVIPTLSEIDVRLDSIYAWVMSPDVVNTFTSFEEFFITPTGDTTEMKGDVTWTVVKHDGVWKLGYGHVMYR